MIVCLCAWLSAGAQTVLFKVTGEGADFQTLKFYIKAMDDQSRDMKELALGENGFQGEVKSASDGFYMLYGSTGQSQLQLPLYLPGTATEYTLPFTMQNGCPQVNMDKDNKALSAFNRVIYTDSRYFWMEGGKMSAEQMLPFLKGYVQKSDSIASLYQCSEPVRQYLHLWAISQAYTAYENIGRVTKFTQKDLSFTLQDFMGNPQEALNMPMAAYFYTSVSILLKTLPKGDLNVRLACLYENCTNTSLREKVAETLLGSYVHRFNYNDGFEAGLQELSEVVEKYNLPQRYVNEFKMRRATVKGAPFPNTVRLLDTEGKEMDFSSFKGSYVYIDLWASWCVPCCKEVPHLQRLEKELNNPDVKFLSISIDQNPAAWKRKLVQLDMHGNQWIDAEGTLGNALNVKGIPFFLIYDKDGKLYLYNAPRPSTGDELKNLLESLK